MLTKDSDSMALEAILWQDLFLHPESQLLSKHFRIGRQDCLLATDLDGFNMSQPNILSSSTKTSKSKSPHIIAGHSGD
jgi:hypothetical protein